MENALVRGRAAHPVRLGDDVQVGPRAHVNGADVADGCFLATTGAALFPAPVSARDARSAAAPAAAAVPVVQAVG